MTPEYLFLILPLSAALALLVLATRRRRIRRRENQQRGLRSLEAMRLLLDLLQQHRGVSTGYLNGGRTLLAQINQLQARITDARGRIIAVHGRIEGDERWFALSEHWSGLSTKFETLSTTNNLRQHNQLIQNLLYLIDDIAQETDLLLLKTADGQPLMPAWRELLIAAECVGQARAVGTGALAAGQCDTVTRIRLNYLYQKIEHTCSLAWTALPPSARQKNRVEDLLNCVREELLSRSRPTIGVSTYFQTASDAVASLYEQFDHLVTERAGYD